MASGRDIAVMADAAHSLGSTRDGVPGGKIAEASILSFHPVKHVAAGEGGARQLPSSGCAQTQPLRVEWRPQRGKAERVGGTRTVADVNY